MGVHWKFPIAAAAAAMLLLSAAAAVEMHADDIVHLTGAHDQLLFAAGEEVTLSVTATDDVAAAGAEVSARGATFAHFFAAGGEISFTDSVADDLFAAGGEIDVLTGRIVDDVIAAGGRITLGPEARVDGDVVVSGGRLRLEAPVGGSLRAAGGSVRLNAAVAGDVFIEGRRIVIGPDARIGGALVHRGASVEIAPEAQIAGQVTALQPRPEVNLRPLAGFAIWASAAILFGLFLLAIAIAAAFPRLMQETKEALRTRPLSMLGLGLAIAILAPFAILFLALTLLGLPLAFVLGAALALLWPVSIVGAVYTAGMLARARLRAEAQPPSTGARVLWAGVATIVFILVGLVPVLGFFVWLLAFLFGLGAVSLVAARALSRQPQPA